MINIERVTVRRINRGWLVEITQNNRYGDPRLEEFRDDNEIAAYLQALFTNERKEK